MIYSDERKDEHGIGPAKIKGFVPELTPKILKKVGGKWYASDGTLSTLLPEEVENPERYAEGASRIVSVNAYERNAKARVACIKHYGAACIVCSFNFQTVYGQIGVGFIHVHHLVPLSEIKKQYELDPIKHLRPVCPNCHAIIHSTQPALTIEQLKSHLGRKDTQNTALNLTRYFDVLRLATHRLALCNSIRKTAFVLIGAVWGRPVLLRLVGPLPDRASRC
jgi:5-methylcytosine-specific restriction protein A